MKTFIYTTVSKARNWGGMNVTCQVYRVKNNKPIHVCEVKFCTASHRGEDHEIINELVKVKQLPKTVLDGSATSYINHDTRDKYFTLSRIN